MLTWQEDRLRVDHRELEWPVIPLGGGADQVCHACADVHLTGRSDDNVRLRHQLLPNCLEHLLCCFEGLLGRGLDARPLDGEQGRRALLLEDLDDRLISRPLVLHLRCCLLLLHVLVRSLELLVDKLGLATDVDHELRCAEVGEELGGHLLALQVPVQHQQRAPRGVRVPLELREDLRRGLRRRLERQRRPRPELRGNQLRELRGDDRGEPGDDDELRHRRLIDELGELRLLRGLGDLEPLQFAQTRKVPGDLREPLLALAESLHVLVLVVALA
mmetsp:Transcript_135667/g.351718  ORF Transcript_135667/g.351718 Transcript_135667/m.351718 type:complete len:274 (+) Transcript_135667:551-1372(+)